MNLKFCVDVRWFMCLIYPLLPHNSLLLSLGKVPHISWDGTRILKREGVGFTPVQLDWYKLSMYIVLVS